MAGSTETQTAVGPEAVPDDPGELCLLVIECGAPSRHRIPAGAALTLGRSEDAGLVLADRDVSRLHAKITNDVTLQIEDLGSSNGTVVCGSALEPGARRELVEGDVVQLGRVTVLVQRTGGSDERRVLTQAELAAQVSDLCSHATPFTLALLAVAGEVPTGRPPVVEVLVDVDTVASRGPGEFAVLVVNPDAAKAGHVIQQSIDRLTRSGMTVRSAIASYPRDGRDCASLLGWDRLYRPDTDRLVVTDASMQAVRALAHRVAQSTLSVLIIGETGVGKEVLADFVHRSSPRSDRPFLCLNCAALPEAILESELFGHERGAFTGATQTKPGLLEVAAGGTVFLDEVTELPLVLQAKLLRVFESREIFRVGGLAPRPIDVRFLAATNRGIEDEVAEKRFREDLYYRLNGITLHIPPLRERATEILVLARGFLAEACARMKRHPTPKFSARAADALLGYRWPGNIRQLKNFVERAAVLSSGPLVDLEHLPPELVAAPATPELDEEAQLHSQLDDLDRRRVVEALEAAGGNQTQAAKNLGIARNTLLARMKVYGLGSRRKPTDLP